MDFKSGQMYLYNTTFENNQFLTVWQNATHETKGEHFKAQRDYISIKVGFEHVDCGGGPNGQWWANP